MRKSELTTGLRAVFAGALLAIIPLPCGAQVITDGTLGRGGALTGPNYAIGAELGRQHGGNLFHSFSVFNLRAAESATFSGPASVTNIVSRVTGGSISSIDGKIASTIAGANLFLINPSGVMFGPNARLEVSGSFYASTADYLRFANGGVFHAANPGASTFSAAEPVSFGFLGPRPETIRFSAAGNFLRVPDGKTLAFIGGDIDFAGARLRSGGGRVYAASAASAGEITLTAEGVAATPGMRLGRINLGPRAYFELESTAGGPTASLFILADTLIMSGDASSYPAIFSGNSFGEGGGKIQIDVRDMELRGGAQIITSAGRGAPGANIVIRASGRMLIEGGQEGPSGAANRSGLTSQADFFSAAGSGGSINIQAGTLEVRNGAQIIAVGFEGSSGPIAIRANRVIIEGRAPNGARSAISGETVGPGNAGDIDMQVGRLEMGNGAVVISNSHGNRLSLGNAGNINITAQDAVSLGEGSQIVAATFGNGQAGRISIAAPVLELRGALVSSQTQGRGNAGTVDVQARRVSIVGGSIVDSSSVGSGNGGAVRVVASEVIDLIGAPGRTTVISSFTGASGRGGAISVEAPLINIAGENTGITTQSGDPVSGASGAGGNIVLRAGTLNITDGGSVASASYGDAPGGNVTLLVDALMMRGGTTITASGFSAGDAGDIRISASDAVMLSAGSGIETRSTLGGGGGITITASRLIKLENSRITTSVSGGFGNGGNIFIDPKFVVLNRSAIQANAYGGNGGNIRIVTDHLVSSTDSRIEASSQLGIDGNIEVTSPNVDVGSGLVVMPGNFDASILLRASCASRAAMAATSSFVGVGRGGLPAGPDSMAWSSYQSMFSRVWPLNERTAATKPEMTSALEAPTGSAWVLCN